MEERALPYYLLNEDIAKDKSYHRYRVIKEISIGNLKDDSRSNPKLAEYLDRGEKVIVGSVAKVEAFGKQGRGGGRQIKFPIAVSKYAKFTKLGKRNKRKRGSQVAAVAMSRKKHGFNSPKKR